MTPRERFLRTMQWQPVDGPPLWEEGIQDDTWDAWRAQGLSSPDAFLRRFPFDRRATVELNLEPIPGFRPRAGERPEAAFRRLAESFRADAARLPGDWARRVALWQDRDYPLGIVVSRGFLQSLGVGDWSTLTSALYAVADCPDEVAAVMEQVGEMTAALVTRVLEELALDFALFSEPIASFHAPVVSPNHYRRLWFPALHRVVRALRAGGVETLVVSTYGNAELLLPLWLELGINCLWCHHAGAAGIDYRALRHRSGRNLRLIGGIDARALLQGPPAIDAALGVVPDLLHEGGYLPLVDDRVRSHVPYRSYVYYRTRLSALAGGRRRDHPAPRAGPARGSRG